MTSTPDSPSEDAPPWARPLLERQIAMAGQLAEGGLEMAMDVKDRALTQPAGVEPAVLEGFSRAYARLARAVRLSLMLQERLIKDLIALDKGAETPAAGPPQEISRYEIVRVFVDPQEDDEQLERLMTEGPEGLDREALERALLRRPASELVAMICKDLDLDPRLAGEAWAREGMAGGDIGWPLAVPVHDPGSMKLAVVDASPDRRRPSG